MSPEVQGDKQFLALIQNIKNVMQDGVSSFLLVVFLHGPKIDVGALANTAQFFAKGAKRIFWEALPNNFCLHLMVLLYLQRSWKIYLS